MLLLDSARPKPVATSTLDLAELQRENSELMAVLRDQRRRRTIRRIRRLSFVGITIGRVAARRSGKHSKGQQATDGSDGSGGPTKSARNSGPDGRAKMLVFFLVLVRVIQSRKQKSAAATGLPVPAEVQP